ncbi:hypothetical protein PG993_012374 [Apiospora rasikravindrae]|uniref:Ubiquitin-like protease family profile domain-containing protein n=1 Tax=Apiospora rasikravindrae TaxID=990691 RepID=A0ABR1S2S0_9PEZI
MSYLNRISEGTKKSSSKPSVLGPQTKGASIQKAKSTAHLKNAKERSASIVGAFAARVGSRKRPVIAPGTPDFDVISSAEDWLPNPVRHARVLGDQTFDFRASLEKAQGYLDRTQFGFTEAGNIYIENLELVARVQGLNNLQHSQRGWLLASAIDFPTRHWLDFLPSEVAGRINYVPPGDYEFHEMFNSGNVKKWAQTMNDILNDTEKPQGGQTRAEHLFQGFLTREYTIFNWNTGGHWGSSLIHMERGADGRYTHVAHIGFIDPMQTPAIVRHVHLRLRGILGMLGCTFAARDVERTFWVPQQRDGYSCGIITAYINKLLIERIADLYMPSGPNRYDDATLWQPGSERFNPREFQGHLAGVLAVDLMRATGYRGRVTVALVDQTTSLAVDPNDFAAQEVSPDPTKFTLMPSRSALKPQKRPTQTQMDREVESLRKQVATGLRVLNKVVPPGAEAFFF